ncbi:MAG: RNA methyltransferase [Oscillospiraceae bacterium]|nr:RNA methyltransferase [Oscillospiraceae bacterium]
MVAEFITSSQNTLIRHVRKLQSSRSYRRECGEFVCEGWKLLEEARKWLPCIKTVIYAKGRECPSFPAQTRVVEVPESLLESLSSMKTPQGVIFCCDLPGDTQQELRPGMLLLDGIQDPGNLGTILRTADAFNIPVLLMNGCADPYSDKTIRASMGAVFRTVPGSISMEALLRNCKDKGIPIAATALTDRAVDLRTLDLRKYITVIGSEGQGICPSLLEGSEQQVIIPMESRCESLNAAIAAAIVMWQIR